MPPAVVTVRTKLSRPAVMAALRRLPAACAGRGGAPAEARQLLTRAGLAFLEKAHPAFIVKAKKGTDDCGLSWQRLAYFTVLARGFAAHDRRRRKAKEKGYAQDDILIDTAKLVDSLEPSAPSSDDAPPPVPPPAVKLQVFRLAAGRLTVGTSRKWARTHHEGYPPKIPQRRLWAEPSHWSARWWGGILTATRLGVIGVARRLLGG